MTGCPQTWIEGLGETNLQGFDGIVAATVSTNKNQFCRQLGAPRLFQLKFGQIVVGHQTAQRLPRACTCVFDEYLSVDAASVMKVSLEIDAVFVHLFEVTVHIVTYEEDLGTGLGGFCWRRIFAGIEPHTQVFSEFFYEENMTIRALAPSRVSDCHTLLHKDLLVREIS